MARNSKAAASKEAAAAILSSIANLRTSWGIHLSAANLSKRTRDNYLRASRQLEAFLVDASKEASTSAGGSKEPPAPISVTDITREHVEAFILHLLETRAASTAATRYRGLQQFFKWCAEEGEIRESPMRNMRPPKIEEKQVPVIPADDLRALLAACKGQDFAARRDTAILSLFIDTGARLAEIAGLHVDDLDLLVYRVAVVTGKGRRDRTLPLSPKVIKSLDRYLRARARHRNVDLEWLWLGRKDELTRSGIAQLIKRRCDQAGIAHIHPHQFRHTFAHAFLSAGGNEGDLMQLAGWRSRQMVSRYAASAAGERAREAHKKFSPMEQL